MRLFRTEEPMESLGKWKKEDTKLQDYSSCFGLSSNFIIYMEDVSFVYF